MCAYHSFLCIFLISDHLSPCLCVSVSICIFRCHFLSPLAFSFTYVSSFCFFRTHNSPSPNSPLNPLILRTTLKFCTELYFFIQRVKRFVQSPSFYTDKPFDRRMRFIEQRRRRSIAAASSRRQSAGYFQNLLLMETPF